MNSGEKCWLQAGESGWHRKHQYRSCSLRQPSACVGHLFSLSLFLFFYYFFLISILFNCIAELPVSSLSLWLHEHQLLRPEVAACFRLHLTCSQAKSSKWCMLRDITLLDTIKLWSWCTLVWYVDQIIPNYIYTHSRWSGWDPISAKPSPWLLPTPPSNSTPVRFIIRAPEILKSWRLPWVHQVNLAPPSQFLSCSGLF